MLSTVGRRRSGRCASTMQSDYLEVIGSAGRPSKRYCSTKDKPLPGVLTATNGDATGDRSELRLIFQTDDVFDASGFQAFYEYSTFVPSMNNVFYILIPNTVQKLSDTLAVPTCKHRIISAGFQTVNSLFHLERRLKTSCCFQFSVSAI